MRNFKRVCSIFVFCLLLMGVFTLGGCEMNETISLVDADNIVSEMNVHPWMLDINNSNFGIKGQKLLSPQKYQQVLSEINFILQNSGMKLSEYQRFIQNDTPDTWFTSSVDEFGYPIEGDMVVSRKVIQELMGKSSGARHIMNTYHTSSGTKTVRVHKNVPAEWQTAIAQAVAAWNSLGYGVQFVISYTNNITDLYNVSGEIDVKFQNTDANGKNFDSGTYASTVPPLSDNAIGEAFHINSSYFIAKTSSGFPGSIIASAKKTIIAHELGHAIGMKHTDAYNGFGLDVPVQGCGLNSTDPTSIMKDGTTFMYDSMPWQGFTSCDKAVIDYYW